MPYDRAVAHDRRTIRLILDLDTQNLRVRENSACGLVPILVLLDLARKHRWQPLLLHYANSGDTAGDKDRVVGYAAIAFFEGAPMSEKNVTQKPSQQQCSREQGQKLIRLARETICEKLGIVDETLRSQTGSGAFDDPCYRAHCGTFVTLKKQDQLRGCIGNLTADKPVLDGIRENAVHAAFRDPRFAPLTPEELSDLQISVSILTEPQPLQYDDAGDLLDKLQAGVDGVIIRRGAASATFLPQVWEQLPRPEDFLSHLCVKAGLAADTWRSANLEVLTYQVQHFEEDQ
jgi:AmmeMemoRadiSam system protein A